MFARKALFFLAVSAGIGFLPQHASALTTTNFNFNWVANGVSSFDLVADGITLKASNFVSADNLSVAEPGSGLCFVGSSGSSCNDLSSLSLTFSSPVKLVSYQTGYRSFSNPYGVSLEFEQNSSKTTATGFISRITNPFSPPLYVDANIPVVVKATISDGWGVVYLIDLTVETATAAVPGPLPISGAAVAFGYSRRLRLRNSRP